MRSAAALDKKQGEILTGFPLGFYSKGQEAFYINNHLRFTVLIHEPTAIKIPYSPQVGFVFIQEK